MFSFDFSFFFPSANSATLQMHRRNIGNNSKGYANVDRLIIALIKLGEKTPSNVFADEGKKPPPGRKGNSLIKVKLGSV